MMTRVGIASAGTSSVNTADGRTLGVIGSGRSAAGDVAWSMGDFAFYPGQPGSRPPIVWAEAAGDILLCGSHGEYATISSEDFTLKTKGSFKNWPTDSIADNGRVRVAYNTKYIVGLSSTVSYDNAGNAIATYTGFDVLTGNPLFSVSGYDVLNSGNFYFEVDSAGHVAFGGITSASEEVAEYTYETVLVMQNCVDGAMTTTKLSAESLGDAQRIVSPATDEAETARIIDYSNHSGYMRAEDGGVTAIVEREDRTDESYKLIQSATIEPRISVDPIENSTKALFNDIIAGNAQSGDYIGNASFSTASTVNIVAHVESSVLAWNRKSGDGTLYAYSRPLVPRIFYSTYLERKVLNSIWPEKYLPNCNTRDGLWEFPESEDAPLYGCWNPDTWDSNAADAIALQNCLTLLAEKPEIGVDGECILVLSRSKKSSSFYIWKNNAWQWNGSGPGWSRAVTPGGSISLFTGDNPYSVAPYAKIPTLSNIDSDYTIAANGAVNYYGHCKSLDASYSAIESATVKILHKGNIKSPSMVTMRESIGISGTETYFPAAITCAGESRACPGSEYRYMHISEYVTWGCLYYKDQVGYGEGSVTLSKTNDSGAQVVKTSLSTAGHDVSVRVDVNGDITTWIDGLISPVQVIAAYLPFASLEFKNKNNQNVFILLCSNSGLLVNRNGKELEKVESVAEFYVVSTQIALVASQNLLGAIAKSNSDA